MNKKESNLLSILLDFQQFQIFILGMFSGMPLFIIYSTLAAWMTTKGIDIKTVTFLASARIFYSLKVLWAPFIDQIKLPLLHKIGRRKSWICLMSTVIAYVIFSYSYLDPKTNMTMIFIHTMFLGFASATLDVVIDGYRIDNVPKENQAIAAANAIFGYRMGKILAVAAALFYAQDFGWILVFQCLAGLYVLFILTIIFVYKEIKIDKADFVINDVNSWKAATIVPFYDFFKRNNALLILFAIIFYKLGDAMLGIVATPFYLDVGFSMKEIAKITKIYGLFATVAGTYIGVYIIYKIGFLRGLIFCGVAQSVTNFAFVWLNHQGHNVSALMVAITIENVASGMGDAALAGYLSYLCNRQFSATQYALFSSASGLASHSIVVFGGSIQELIGWDAYFSMTVILAIPGLWLFYILHKESEHENREEPKVVNKN